MARRRAVTATRPPDVFIEAYEASHAARLKVGGWIEIVGGYSGQYNGKVSKVLRLNKKEQCLEVAIGDSKAWFEMRYVRAIDSMEAAQLQVKATADVEPADLEGGAIAPQPDALTDLLLAVAEDFESKPEAEEEAQGFKVGDRVSPKWKAGSDRQGKIIEIFTKGKKEPQFWAKIQWDKGRKEDLGTSDVRFDQLVKAETREAAIAPNNKPTAIIGNQSEPIITATASPANPHELAAQPSLFAEAYEAEGKEIISNPLTRLALDIKAAHTDCEQALTVARSAESSALEHAKRCGDLLLEAKKANGHGGWEAWRTENTGIPSSTASLYQRVAERWDEIREGKIESLKGVDRHFREAKKLKSNPQPSADLPKPEQPARDDRQVVPAAEVEQVAHSGWIQTKAGQNLNPLHYRVEGAATRQVERPEGLAYPDGFGGAIDEGEGEFTELPELDEELIAAHLVSGDARATIEALLEQICFLAEDECSIPTDPPNPYKGWQIATDSPNLGMVAICLYTPWGAWWALPTEEFFDHNDHDRAIELAQGIIDRLEVAAQQAEKPQPKTRKVKVGAGHLRAIAKDQSASAFKLLSGMKGNLPDEVDLLGVADALEEAIMQVLEEWILGEEG